MRLNFKKITSVLASVAMIGSTIGFAAAANYPAPFNKVGDVAIVWGANADILDGTQAGLIQTNLAAATTSSTSSTSSSTTGGDSVKLERSSDKFNLGDTATSVFVTSITKDHLPALLADGTYLDDNNDEFTFEQKIDLGTLTFDHFSDSEYKDDVPTLGFNLSSDTPVLNYTLNFKKDPNLNASYLETTEMTILGKTYYVLDVEADTNKTTFLDSASSVTVAEGEEQTVTTAGGTYKVSISYIGSTTVKLTVNDETTNSLADGQTYKLSDGSYVGIKEILYNSKTGTTSSVEFSIGKGKLELSAIGDNVELNDENVDGLYSWIVSSGAKLDKIVLEWKTDDTTFLTPDKDLTLPGFENVKLTMGSVVIPGEEEVKVEYSGNDKIKLTAPIKDGTFAQVILAANATGDFTAIGESSSKRIATAAPDADQLFYNYTGGDRYFTASWNTTTEAESYLLEISSGGFEKATSSTEEMVTITNSLTSATVCEDKKAGDTCTVGNIVFTINEVNANESTARDVNMTIAAGGSFNRLYTVEGMEIDLPFLTSTDATVKGAINGTFGAPWEVDADSPGHTLDSFYIYFQEEDKDGNLGAGNDLYVTVDDTSDKVTVSDIVWAAGEYEIDDSDDYEAYAQSALATKVVYDTGGDQDTATITYHGTQVYADVFVAAPDVSVSGGGELGNVIVTDAEIAGVKTKNLIVVGGSCINSVAAELLGGALCSSAFTTATGVGSDQFLIKVFTSPYTSSKIALLVAGYEKADTQKATTYLLEETVPTTVGTSIKKQTATLVDVV